MRRLRSTRTSATWCRDKCEMSKEDRYAVLISSPIFWPTILTNPDASSNPTTSCNVPARWRRSDRKNGSRARGTEASWIDFSVSGVGMFCLLYYVVNALPETFSCANERRSYVTIVALGDKVRHQHKLLVERCK